MTSPARFYKSIQPGDPAPKFTLPAFPGEAVNLADHLGKWNILLVFYFRDFVGKEDLAGICTNAALSLLALSAAVDVLSRANTVLFAVSRDSLASHKKMAALFDLSIPLLADESGDVGEQYGLLPENRWAGSSYSYDYSYCAVIIDRKGIIRHWQTCDLIVPLDVSAPAFLREKFPLGLNRSFVGAATIDAGALVKIAKSLEM